MPAQNFNATALTLDSSITGEITLAGTTTPLANVPVTLTYNGTITGGIIFKTKTARDGTYSFPNLVADSGYGILPALANYTFTPANPALILTGVPLPQDFSATHVFKLSGRIYGLPANTLSVDFNVGANNDSPSLQTVSVDGLGRFVTLIPNLPIGNKYTVTPVAGGNTSGYSFVPTSYTFPIGPTTTLVTKNFTAVHP
jgi:hypothetical protein